MSMRPVPINPLQSMPPEPRKPSRGPMSPARWLKQRILSPDEAAITSLGEFALPTLLGAMEACWVDAILLGLASLGVLNLSMPLLPLWTPFVYLVGAQWVLVFLDRRSTQVGTGSAEDGNPEEKEGVKSSDATIFFALTAALSLIVIWLQLYASTYPFYNLVWLGTLGSDILFLNLHFYQAIFIVALSFYLSWRGLRHVGRVIEPSQVMHWLLLGLGVMVAVILLRAALESAGANFHDTVLLFLFIPLLLFLGLVAHALARIVFVRKTHYTGLQGSVVAQERAVITVIGSLGLLLLVVTVSVGLTASPAFFGSAISFLSVIGHAIANAYNWLVNLLADVMVILFTPLFWLVSWISGLFPHRAPSSQPPPAKPKPKPRVQPVSNDTINALLPIMKVLAPILLLLLVVGLIWLALRRRRKLPLRLSRLDEDLHESLWSWLLLWSQLKAMLRALFGRFFSRGSGHEDMPLTSPAEIVADPAARTIREIYRALLKKAAGRGYPRRKDETPHEFRRRLDERAPVVEPQLEAITEAYAQVRYGGSLLDEVKVASVRGQWSELDQKWV
ncbi:MAG TPA: DUF4129 domain-containing protein [Ktedonobacteraceae bacterium]|nr:DUF4129 domain-containing protein [Ktedonobacteraceae bacterium]